tara:strand:- start:525 stop:728 length:204 start_codon:yes stop_codon:yes gene_type:complete
MAFKMKGFSGFGNKDKRILRKSNKKLIKEQRELYKQGKITKDQFKSAKKEIKGYTDVDVAKEHLQNK